MDSRKTKTSVLILCILWLIMTFSNLHAQTDLSFYLNQYASQSPELEVANQVLSIYEANQKQSKRMAYDLGSMMDLGFDYSDPVAIMDAYKDKMDQINKYIQQKQQKLNDEFAGQAMNIIQDLALDGSIDPVNAAIGILSSAGKQSEINEAKQKAMKELKSKLSYQMGLAKRDLLESNNEAIDDLVQSAADAFYWVEEEYFLAFIEYYMCYSESIEENYNYMDTEWLNNPCREPQKTMAIPNMVQKEHEKYYQVARRKHKLYKEFDDEAFRIAANRYASTALTHKEDYFDVYLFKAKIASNNAEMFNNLLIANYLRPEDQEVQQELQVAQNRFKRDFIQAAKKHDTRYLQYAIDHSLNSYIETDEGQGLILMMIDNDNADGLQLLLNQEAMQSENLTSRLENLMAICCIKDAGECVERLCRLGVDPNWRNQSGMTPLKLAIQYNSVTAISKLMEQGADYESLLSKYTSQGKTAEKTMLAEAMLFYGIDDNDEKIVKKAIAMNPDMGINLIIRDKFYRIYDEE